VGGHPTFVEAADFDLDGLLDLATLWGHSTLAVHLQQLPGPFSLVEGGAAGVHGAPLLKLAGELVPDTELDLLLKGAARAMPVTLIVGTSALPMPFKGGVLVPAPDLILPTHKQTDAEGELTLRTRWPAGVASGTSILIQAWLPDPAAAQGWAGSTGVELLSP
jgi:hypothetical protein